MHAKCISENTATRIMTQVTMQKKFFLFLRFLEFCKNKCPMYRISIFINRGEWWRGIYTIQQGNRTNLMISTNI